MICDQARVIEDMAKSDQQGEAGLWYQAEHNWAYYVTLMETALAEFRSAPQKANQQQLRTAKRRAEAACEELADRLAQTGGAG